MQKKIEAFEVIDHGIDYPDYFPGCGTSGTEYSESATGTGNDANEALSDALDSLAQNGWDVPDSLHAEMCTELYGEAVVNDEDSYYYVSVMVR